MARIRTIKPDFHSHEELSSLPADTHLLAAALVNYADDEGYFNAHPILVKAGTNPLRNDPTPIDEQLHQLCKIGYIEIAKRGDRCFGRIVTFATHQRVSNPTPSKIREKFEALPKVSVETMELFRPEGNRREQGIEEEQGTARAPSVCDPKPIPVETVGRPEQVFVRDAIERLFAFYCAKFGLTPDKYGLTVERRAKAQERLRERIHANAGSREQGERDLAKAIENLAASEFHQRSGFTDWTDHIFRSTDIFEKRLNWIKPRALVEAIVKPLTIDEKMARIAH